MLASVYSYRVMVKSVSSCCVRGRQVLSNPVTYIIYIIYRHMHIICAYMYVRNIYAHCISIQSYIQRNKLRKGNSFMKNLVHKPLIRGEKWE